MSEATLAQTGTPTTRKSEACPDEACRAVCELVATGISVTKACEQANVVKGTFLMRAGRDPDIAAMYQSARFAQGDAHFDLIIDKIHEMLNDSGGMTKEQARSVRVALDKLQWTAAKLKPLSYADRKITEHEIGGNFAAALEKIESIKAKTIDLKATSRSEPRQARESLPLHTRSDEPSSP